MNNLWTFFGLICVVALIMVGWWWMGAPTPVPEPVDDSTPVAAVPIQLYYYNPALDQGPGGVQCSRQGLVAVDRILSPTQTPLQDSVRLLLSGELSEEERAAGITTEFPLPGLLLESAAISNGVATLTFSDPQMQTSGGACRSGVLWMQIEATALQFPSVNSVRFLPDELFQP